MSTYARLDPLTSQVRDLVDLTQAQFDALAGNPKQAFIRPLVVDAMPVPTSAQLVYSTGYVTEADRVRQTWALRDKLPHELDMEAEAQTVSQLKALANTLQTDIAAGVTPAPSNLAGVVADLQDLKRRALRTDRVILWLLRHQ